MLDGYVFFPVVDLQETVVADYQPRDPAEDAETLLELWDEHGNKQCEVCWKPAFHEDEEGLPYCPSCWNEVVEEQFQKLRDQIAESKKTDSQKRIEYAHEARAARDWTPTRSCGLCGSTIDILGDCQCI